MLKPLHKSDTKTLPFITTKDWSLSNTFNDWVVLTEHSGGLPVAMEYTEYIDSELTISINSSCNVALEQQDGDRVKFRTGKKSSGIFYPDSEETNIDGTYKRVVHSQVRNMFYNNFRDPTQIWGLEYLDFENSQTKRFLGDAFVLYDVPTDIFGEKVLENTVVIYDRVSDDNYTIIDDGHGNLVAVQNLFSKKQELGDFANEFLSGSSSYCNGYFGWPDTIIEVSAGDTLSSIHSTLVFGNLNAAPPNTDTFGVLTGFSSGSLVDTIMTTSSFESSSVSLAFYSGSIVDVIIITSSFESASVSLAFNTGSIVDVIFPTSSIDSSSVTIGFVSGSIINVVTIEPLKTEYTAINVGLLSGSLS